jgi:hypothetical protein
MGKYLDEAANVFEFVLLLVGAVGFFGLIGWFVQRERGIRRRNMFPSVSLPFSSQDFSR